MKNKLMILVKGELQRLNKYNVFSISVLVAIIWGVILFFLKEDVISNVLPLVIVMDATMMSVMYIGSVMYFEKNESTISTMLVTPVSNNDLVLSKVLANVIHNLFSSSLLIIVFIIFKDINLNIPLVFLGLIVSTIAFTIGGLCLSYFQKDFTGMLLNVMILAFVLFIPVALYMLEIIDGPVWEVILLFNPVQAVQEVIGGAFDTASITWKYFVSLGYLTFGSLGLYILFAIPKFQEYAIKQSGV